MLKFCLKKRVYPAKRGDGHWHSQIFWRLGQVITMTVTEIMNLKKSHIVTEFRCIGSLIWKFLNTEVRFFHLITLWILTPKAAAHSPSPQLRPSVW